MRRVNFRFLRHMLPEPRDYFDSRGIELEGRGKWRTTACPIHGGSDSMRVNVHSGAFRCMNCGVRGGDVLAFEQQLHGIDFVDAAMGLGAGVFEDKPVTQVDRPRTLSARQALELLGLELHHVWLTGDSIRKGKRPSDEQWMLFLSAFARVQAVAEEFRA